MQTPMYIPKGPATAPRMVNEFHTYWVKAEKQKQRRTVLEVQSDHSRARLPEVEIAAACRMDWKGVVSHRKLLNTFQFYTTTVAWLTPLYMRLVYVGKTDDSVHKYSFLSTETGKEICI